MIQYLKTKEVKNFSIRLLFVVLNKVVALGALTLTTLILTPDQFGFFQFIFTIAGYSFIIANWGFLEQGIRKIRSNLNFANEVVNEIIAIRTFLWFIGSIICIIVALFLNLTESYILTLCLALISNLGLSLNIDYYFYAKKNVLTPVIFRLISQILYIISLLFLIYFEAGINGIFLALFITKLVEALILLFISKIKINLNYNFRVLYNTFVEQASLGLSSKAGFVMNSIPILLIPIIIDFSAAGFYAIAYRVVTLIYIIYQTTNLIISPKIVDLKLEKLKLLKLFKKTIVLYLIICIVILLMVNLIGGKVILLIFGTTYSPVVDTLNMLLLFLLPISALKFAVTVFLNNLFLDTVFLRGSIIGLTLAVFLIPLGIYYYGIIGAVLALSIATTGIVIYLFFKIYKFLIC